jgi:hypothetical protein
MRSCFPPFSGTNGNPCAAALDETKGIASGEPGNVVLGGEDSMRAQTVVVVLMSSWILCSSLCGQNDMLTQIYGEGVHAFFRGDYGCAGSTMDQAIAHGSQDPRVHYFRGLSHLRLGRYFEAGEDFRTAATLEVEGTGTFDIGRALERIQGSERLCLERIRRDTLLTLSQQRPVPSVRPGVPAIIPDFGRDLPQAPDPFRDEDERPMEILPEEEQPPAPPPPAPGDVTPPAEGEEEDPFAAPAEDAAPEPEPPAPAETDEETEAEDIFGTDPGDNPFE